MKKHMSGLNVNQMQIVLITGFLIILTVLLFIANPKLITPMNLSNLIRQAAFTLMVGCAATFVVIQGNIDISVGSVLAFNCVLFAIICKATGSIALAAVGCMAMGAVAGVLNGAICVGFGIPAIVATMGTMNVFRGLAFIICGGSAVNSEGMFPENYSYIGRGMVFGKLPFPLIILIIVIAFFLFLEKKSVLGKYSLAIGGNKMAALLAGINIKKVQFVSFILTGCMAGLAGAVMASRMGIGEPKSGYDFEFDVMIAVIMGGTSMKGGEGKVIGTIIAAFIVAMLDNGMNLMGIMSFYQFIIKGAVLVFSVIMTQLLKRRYNAKLMASYVTGHSTEA